jgi:hypothetical protein
MKRMIALVSLCITALILMSCAAGRYPYPSSDLAKETWLSQVQTNSLGWVSKADSWFRDGGRALKGHLKHVNVADFHTVNLIGDFQTQMFDEEDHGGVWIEGPSEAVHALSISVRDSILCIEQSPEAPANMGRVIVHIGVRNLRGLSFNGNGRVEGIRLASEGLRVQSAGCGNIYLAGEINVRSVISRGAGSVNIFTLHSDRADIESHGSGDVNIDAKDGIALRSIKHTGTGDINIIGATSNGLSVDADGKGKIGISGPVIIKYINANGETCVFIAHSAGGDPNIAVNHDARVGIAGQAGTLRACTSRSSRLMARNLIACTIYVEASGTSHMNVFATEKAFATASDYATIYYFGDPSVLVAFERNNGSVVRMCWVPAVKERIVVYQPRDYKGEAGPHYGWRKGRLREL